MQYQNRPVTAPTRPSRLSGRPAFGNKVLCRSDTPKNAASSSKDLLIGSGLVDHSTEGRPISSAKASKVVVWQDGNDECQMTRSPGGGGDLKDKLKSVFYKKKLSTRTERIGWKEQLVDIHDTLFQMNQARHEQGSIVVVPDPASALRSARAGLGKDLRLSTCEEGCYWRWVVHTLLDDVASLKHKLDYVYEELNKRAEERRVFENCQVKRMQLQDECRTLISGVSSFQEQVPELQVESKRLHAEIERIHVWQREHKQRASALRIQLEDLSNGSEPFEQQVVKKEREAKRSVSAEQSVREQIKEASIDTTNTEQDFQHRKFELQMLKGEIAAGTKKRGFLKQTGEEKKKKKEPKDSPKKHTKQAQK